MRFNRKTFYKLGIYTALFGCSTAVTYFILAGNSKSRPNDDANNLPTVTEKAGQRLIQSILGYEGIGFDGYFNIILDDGTSLNLDLDGKGTLQDIENIQLQANINANLSGIKVSGELGYFGDTLTFSLKDRCNFYLETDDITDFVSMIPEYGINIELPSELQNIDLTDLMNRINEIDVEDRKTTDGGNSYYYVFDFGSGDFYLPIYIKTDLDDHFLGIRTDTFIFKGNMFKIDLDLNEITGDLGLVNPLSDLETKSQYQNFKPAFQLFDAIYKLTQKSEIGVDLIANLDRLNEDNNFEDVLDLNLGLDLDFNNNTYGIKAQVDEGGRSHVAEFDYISETIYAAFHNVKVSIDTATITSLIQFALEKLGGDVIEELVGGLAESASSIDLSIITELTNNLYGSFKTLKFESDDLLALGVDLAPFGLNTKFEIKVDFANDELNSISIVGLKISDLCVDLVINFVAYAAPSVNLSEYEAIEPSLVLVESVLELIPRKQFRIEFDGKIDDGDDSTKPVTLDGGLQFDIERNLGYGELDIVDMDSYTHNVKADMIDGNDFIFSYNNKLNGKFDSETLTELLGLILNIVNNPDDHFHELFDGLLGNLQDSVLMRGISGEYGLLLNYDIISNLEITDEQLSFDLSFEILGFEDTKMHLELNYVPDYETTTAKFDSLKISELNFMGIEIELNAYLRDFDEKLESTRLDRYQEYMDFSDIKTLLELGINTSKFNYYHLAGDVTLNIETALLSIGVFNLDIPIDIKVLNNHGKVKVAVEFTNLPMLSIIGINLTPNNDGYTSAQNRKASFYWTDDLFYVYRTEQAKEKSWLGTPKGDFHDFELYGKYDGEYFLDNIIEILLRDILSLSDTIYDLIDSSATSGGSGEAHQIQYENVVSNFVFQKNEGIFKVGLDLNELTGLDLFNSTELTIKEDKNANILNDIYAVVSMTVGLKMTATIDIMLLDDYVENIDDNPGQYTTKIDSYVEAHKDDILNKKYKKYNGSAI